MLSLKKKTKFLDLNYLSLITSEKKKNCVMKVMVNGLLLRSRGIKGKMNEKGGAEREYY